MCKIICVTNRHLCKRVLTRRIEDLLKANVDEIILREKDLSEDEYCELAKKTIALCDKYDKPCILHNFPSVAKKLNHRAIHLPLPVLESMSEEDRAFFNVLGASCHSVDDAVKAEKLGCTYIVAGNIYETQCKEGLKGKGLDFLSDVCKSVSIPVYAIGGVNSDNLSEVCSAGAKGGAMMSELMDCGAVWGLSDDRYERKFDEKYVLYAITNRKTDDLNKFYNDIESALKGGVTILQLREKHLDEKAFIEEARAVKEICYKYNVPLIINDNLKVAFESGADGVHVGAEDMAVADILDKVASEHKKKDKCRIGKHFIVGATVKSMAQAKSAFEQGASYYGIGAMFPSPTKPNAIAVDYDELKEICMLMPVPAVAIGGITIRNIDKLKGSYINGVAVVSSIFDADDIEKATRELKEKVKMVISK